MSKKNKVSIGQCYSYHDRVFMVVANDPNPKLFDYKRWRIEDTLSKERYVIPEQCLLLECSRPFQNFG